MGGAGGWPWARCQAVPRARRLMHVCGTRTRAAVCKHRHAPRASNAPASLAARSPSMWTWCAVGQTHACWSGKTQELGVRSEESGRARQYLQTASDTGGKACARLLVAASCFAQVPPPAPKKPQKPKPKQPCMPLPLCCLPPHAPPCLPQSPARCTRAWRSSSPGASWRITGGGWVGRRARGRDRSCGVGSRE